MTTPGSLTQTEAEARAALIDVRGYEISVDITELLDGDALRSRSRIEFTCHTPGSDSFVDCVAEIESAVLNGIALDLTSVVAGRLPLPGLAAENVLEVIAATSDTGRANGILRTVDPSDKLVYVWTSFEPDDARNLWACFDQPDLKAPHRFRVVAPEAWTVTSNCAPDSVVEELPEDWPFEAATPSRTWEFPATPPLSTYVVVINAGPFYEVRRELGGYDLGMLCRQSLRKYLDRDLDDLFEVTAAGLAWYGEQFAQPFPQGRYDHVFVPNMGGAMENWGCVTCTDTVLFRSSPSMIERGQRASLLMHEMAHMWFGDLVTMQWWDDLWLNEAFATWAAEWTLAGATEFQDVWAVTNLLSKTEGYRADMSPGTHPIRADIPDVTHAMANFDAITYQKGAAVLKQLAAYVGEDAFVAGLQAYFAEHAYGNTRLVDLITAVSRDGADLTDWTPAWLDRAGTDTISLADAVLTITAPDGGQPRGHRLQVHSFVLDDNEAELLAVTDITTSGSRTQVDLPDAVHLVNGGDLTFAAVRTDIRSQAALDAHAGQLPDSLSRALVTTTAWDRLVKGELSAAGALAPMLSVLASETSSGVVEVLFGMAGRVAEHYCTAADSPRLRAQLADVALARSTEPALRQSALRALASHGSTPDHFAALAGVDDPASAQHDLAWRLLARRAELGEYDADLVDAMQKGDSDPEAWVSALRVRAALDDASAKEEVWDALVVQRSTPSGMPTLNLARSFWRVGQDKVLAPFTSRYLDAVSGLSMDGLLSLGSVLRGAFPVVATDAAFLQRADIIAQDEQTPAPVRQALLVSCDALRRMERARAN